METVGSKMEKIELVKAIKTDDDYIYKMICDLENQILDYKVFKENFYSNLCMQNIDYYVIESNGKKCGFVSLYTSILLHHNSRITEIQELIIEEKYRRNGMGRKVIDLAEKICKDNKVEQLEVCTNIKRTMSQNFYKNNGFNETHYKYTKKL